MSKRVLSFAALLLAFLSFGLLFGAMKPPTVSANGAGTRLLRTPTVSATQIAFAHANNIWVVERAGGTARRLTSFQGQTSNPHFSPDGKFISYFSDKSGEYKLVIELQDGLSAPREIALPNPMYYYTLPDQA